jgi:hypothetical protein
MKTLVFALLVLVSVSAFAQTLSPGQYLEKAADYKEIAMISRFGAIVIPTAVLAYQAIEPQKNPDMGRAFAIGSGILLLSSSVVYEFKAINFTRKAGIKMQSSVAISGVRLKLEF